MEVGLGGRGSGCNMALSNKGVHMDCRVHRGEDDLRAVYMGGYDEEIQKFP